MGPWIPLFWTSGDVSTEFQSQSEQSYSHFAEAYVKCVSRDSPLGWHLLTYMAAWQPVTVPHMCVSTAFVVSRKVMFSVVSVCQSIIHDAIGQIGTLHHMDQFKLVHMWPPILHPPSTYLLKLSCCVWYFTDNCMYNMSLSCTLLTVGDLFCNKYEIYSFEMAAVCLVNDSLAYLSYLK